MHEAAPMALWTGRVDPEPGGERWHQRVAALDPFSDPRAPAGIVLLGICSDEGVSRNLGRAGARGGPDAVRGALANLAWHLEAPLYDAGNLHCEGGDLEGVQEEQSSWVARLLDLGHLPLLLGGGHEMALGSYLGLRRHLRGGGERGTIGIVNFDSHFDLRSAERSTSGTPFRQIAESDREDRPLYLCVGASEPANTAALFARAAALGGEWLLDEELPSWDLARARERLSAFAARCDFLHLSIDLDVLPAAVAPGVSAPAPRGVPLEVLESLLTVVKESGKLRIAEIAEMNPLYDIDGRTAKVAARLCHLLARGRAQTVPYLQGGSS